MARRIAIVGSREYPCPERVREYVRALPKDAVIVSGAARGVDRVAIDEARRCGLSYEEYPANWIRDGKRAGFLRNAVVVAQVDEVVAFWDGRSRGTKHTIDLARAAGKPVGIIGP